MYDSNGRKLPDFMISSSTKKNKKYKSDGDEVEFHGKIHYFKDFVSIAENLCSLIEKVESLPIGDVIVAFSIQRTANFKGSGIPSKTSLIQVAMDVDNSYEFHLSNVKKLPAGLSVFLGHERVRLCGFNIKGNLQTFKKDFPIINIKNMVDRCIDLAAMYNKVCRSSERWSMLERLVHQTLKMKFEKTKTVRTSKWHEVPLTYNQMKYAATEVYVTRKVYDHIKSKENQY